MNRNLIIVDRKVVRSEALARACNGLIKDLNIFIFPDPITNKGKQYIPESDGFEEIGEMAFTNLEQDQNESNETTQYFLDDDDLSYLESNEDLRKEIPFLELWDIALRHYSEDDIVLRNSMKIEIWYGGGGAEYDKGKEWNINLELDEQEDVETFASHSWLSEVIDWALMDERSRIIVGIPYVLRKRDYSLTSSLAILCQGYIVASFLKSDRVKEKTMEALEKMGWLDFIKTGEGKKILEFRDRVKNNFLDFSEWIKTLGNLKKDYLKKKIAYELSIEEKELEKEIESLTNGIYDDDWPKGEDGKERDHNEVIAEAYIKIADELERVI